MEKQFDIEIINEESNDEGNVQLPLNFLSLGKIEPDDVKIYIKQNVYKELEKFASSDTSKELGSILIGDYCEQMGKTYVVISDFIEAKYTDASASTLTFTHETWDYVHKQHDILYPNKKIVGWQHTHPNYGIFLSNYDLFIQENFFNLPFQIAYVIDPIQNIRGFFQWKNGKIEKLKGYYVYDDVGKNIKIEQKKAEKPKSDVKSVPGKISAVVISLLCIITLVFGVLLININNKYNEQIKMQETIVEKLEHQDEIINEQEQNINEQKQNISDLQTKLINSVIDNSGTTTARNLIDEIEKNEIEVENKDQVLSELKKVADDDENNESIVSFKVYTVKSGDTLLSICEKNRVDYENNKMIILSLNGIYDLNFICTGQKILLPIS